MDKNYVLFDLDGTLTDSQEGIKNAIKYSLASFGITVKDDDQLRPWLGPPLVDSLMKYCDFDRDKAIEGTLKFREYYNCRGYSENKVYPGIEDLLRTLKQRGYQLMTATSKPEAAARRILQHFGLNHYFAYIGGAALDESRVRKADVIRYVLETNNITRLSEVMMIGDREHDVFGAKATGLEVIGVLYGYGDREELEQAGADYIVETVGDILKYL